MREFWQLLRGIVFAPVRFVFGILKWTLALVMLIVAVYAGMEWLEYRTSAHAFARSDKCDLQQRLFGDLALPFVFNCIDATTRSEPEIQNFVFFMANEERPRPDRTGHGWMALAQVRTDPDKLLVTRFRVFGFWGDNTDRCPEIMIKTYVWVSQWLPATSRAFIEKNYKALCMGGQLGNEGMEFVDPAGREVQPITDVAELKNIFNNIPAVMLVAAIDTEEFNNILFRVDQYAKIDYSIVLSDCTTMLYRLADSIGLYTPPRLLFPYPSSSVDAIRRMNIRRAAASTIDGR